MSKLVGSSGEGDGAGNCHVFLYQRIVKVGAGLWSGDDLRLEGILAGLRRRRIRERELATFDGQEQMCLAVCSGQFCIQYEAVTRMFGVGNAETRSRICRQGAER